MIVRMELGGLWPRIRDNKKDMYTTQRLAALRNTCGIHAQVMNRRIDTRNRVRVELFAYVKLA